MTETLFQDWADLHEDTPYPFTDAATMRSTGGLVTLPRNAIVDAAIGASTTSAATYVSLITRTATAVVISFAQSQVVIGTVTIGPSDDGWLDVVDTSNAFVGRVKINRNLFAVLFGWAVRSYTFAASALPLVPYATYFRPSNGVRGFKLPDGTVLTGDVTLLIGYGIAVSTVGSAWVLTAKGNPFVGVSGDGLIPRAIRTVILETKNLGDSPLDISATPNQGALSIVPTAGTGANGVPALKLSTPSPSEVQLEIL